MDSTAAPTAISWATVLASTVIGSLISGAMLWINDWRKRRAESVQKTADRKHAWRREVYMDAVDAVQGLIVRMAHTEKYDPEASLEDVHRFLAMLAKVWLVAERPASDLSRDLVDDAMESFLNSAERRIDLHQALARAPSEFGMMMARLDFAERTIESNRALQTTMARLVAALRAELEIEGIDEKEMVCRTNLSTERAKGTLDRLRQTMTRVLSPQA